jgi:hypothetical protein
MILANFVFHQFKLMAMAKGKIPNIAVTYNWLGSRVLGFKSRRQTLGENAEKNSERYLLSV